MNHKKNHTVINVFDVIVTPLTNEKPGVFFNKVPLISPNYVKKIHNNLIM